MKGADFGRALGIGKCLVGHFESGKRVPKANYIPDLIRMAQTDEQRARLLELMKEQGVDLSAFHELILPESRERVH